MESSEHPGADRYPGESKPNAHVTPSGNGQSVPPHSAELDAARQQLQRIVSSRAFSSSERHQRFLRYAIERTLEGQGEPLKEYSLGVEIFERSVDFDPRVDTVVRVEAHRLRARLKKYYETEGLEDKLIIEFPVGAYVPSFRIREVVNSAEQGDREPPQAVKKFTLPLTRVVALVGTSVVLVALFALLLPRNGKHAEGLRRFAIVTGDSPTRRLAPMDHYPILAISPDGHTVVYAGIGGEGRLLYMRRLDEFETKPIQGTAGVSRPFFSPDGNWIGFFANGKLQKIAVANGSPLTICECDGHGGTWRRDGTIIIGGNPNIGLRIVSPTGQVRDLTKVNREAGERAHAWPHFLPDGEHILYGAWLGGGYDQTPIYRYSLKSGQQQQVALGSSAVYVPSGHLLYARDTNLLAARFDPGKGTAGAELVAIAGLAWGGICGVSHFAVSSNRTLAYATEPREDDRLISWVETSGKQEPIVADRRAFHHARLSPDRKQLAVSVIEDGRYSIWVLDLSSKAWRRVTTGMHRSFYPIWSPDGVWIAFVSDPDGRYNLYRQRADGSAPAERLSQSPSMQMPLSWAPDGSGLLFLDSLDGAALDIQWLPLNGSSKSKPFLASQHQEEGAQFPPDGKWVAYVSNQSGRREVYVTRFSDPSNTWQVSTRGGRSPVWAAADELVYQAADSLIAASVRLERIPIVGTQREIMRAQLGDAVFPYLTNFDVDRKGKRLVVLTRPSVAQGSSLNVVTNWLGPKDSRAAF